MDSILLKVFQISRRAKRRFAKQKKCRRIIVAVWVGLFLLSVITIALQASISRNCLASTYALYCPTVLVYLCIFPLFGLPSPTDKMLSILISWRWNVTAICWRELQREGKNILPPDFDPLAPLSVVFPQPWTQVKQTCHVLWVYSAKVLRVRCCVSAIVSCILCVRCPSAYVCSISYSNSQAGKTDDQRLPHLLSIYRGQKLLALLLQLPLDPH